MNQIKFVTTLLIAFMPISCLAQTVVGERPAPNAKRILSRCAVKQNDLMKLSSFKLEREDLLAIAQGKDYIMASSVTGRYRKVTQFRGWHYKKDVQWMLNNGFDVQVWWSNSDIRASLGSEDLDYVKNAEKALKK